MSETLLLIGVELSAVALFTLMAGAGSEAGTVMVIFMTGLWLIFMVSDSKAISGISNAITNVASNA